MTANDAALSKPLRRRTNIALPHHISARAIVVGLVTVVVAGLVVYPAVMVVAASFLATDKSGLTANQTWFSGYSAIASNLAPLSNTFVVSIGSTVVAVGFGAIMAWATARTNVPCPKLITAGVIIPFCISPLVLAIGWQILAGPGSSGLLNQILQRIPLVNGFALNVNSSYGIIWVMGLHFTPVSYLMLHAVLQRMEPALEEASQVHGAGLLRTARTITLPLMRPALLGSSLLVFVLSMGQFGVPAVLGMGRGYPVLATTIYEDVNQLIPNYQEATALGVVVFVIAAVGVMLQYKLLGGRSYTTVSARGYRAKKVDLKVLRWPLFGVSLLYIVVSCVLPVGALLWTSLLKYVTKSFTEAHYTLGNFQYILRGYALSTVSLKNTVILGLIAATITVVLCSIVSWAMSRTKGLAPRLLNWLTLAPVAIPAVVFAIGLLWAWLKLSFLPIYGTLWILLICYITMFIPFGIQSITPGIAQIDRGLEESSVVCGSGWVHTIRKITFPLLRPVIANAWALIFILAINEVAAAALLSNSKTVVVGVAIFDILNKGSLGAAAALSVIQIALVVLLLGLAQLFKNSATVRMPGRKADDQLGGAAR
jgi:iron(III) transport system permease protein